MHRDSMSGPRATFREVTIATGNLSPSISSGERIGFDGTRRQYPDTLEALQSIVLAGNGRARSVYEFQSAKTA